MEGSRSVPQTIESEAGSSRPKTYGSEFATLKIRTMLSLAPLQNLSKKIFCFGFDNSRCIFFRVVRDRGLDVPDRYWGSYRPGQLLTAYYYYYYLVLSLLLWIQKFFVVAYVANYRSIKFRRNKDTVLALARYLLVFISDGILF